MMFFPFIEIADIIIQSGCSASLFYSTNPRTAIATIICFFFFYYYFRKVVKKPDFYCRDGKFRWFILANCPQINEKYWPTFWCFETHAQTALATAIRGTLPNLRYKRELVYFPDGGVASLDWYIGSSNGRPDIENRPIALFMPGLVGDSQKEYIKSLIPNAHSLGYRVVAFNNRGLGGVALTTPRLYCAANCDDVKFVVSHIKKKWPKSKIVATGVSLGGIVLCRYLIESGDDSLVDAAMLISICYDLNAGCRYMSLPGLNMALNRYLAKCLIKVVIEQEKALRKLSQINYDHVCQSTTMTEFDERFTTKMFNFSSTKEYYTESSLKGRLNLIKRPTLCINAADDMFSPFDSLPINEIENSSHVGLLVTQKGGHIGFMEGIFPMLPFFTEKLSQQYLGALIRLDDIKKEFSF